MEQDRVALAVGTLLALVALAALSASVPLPEPGDAVAVGEGSGSDAEPAQPPTPPSAPGGLRQVFLAALGLILVGSLFAVRRLLHGTTSEKPEFEAEPSPDSESTDTIDGTQAREEAERAAERIADTATDTVIENEVYRAWYGMTRALGARDPRSETPGRFADLAIRAGMDEDAVTELTALFNDVRYGERTLTDRDEERAVELLRRLAAGEEEE